MYVYRNAKRSFVITAKYVVSVKYFVRAERTQNRTCLCVCRVCLLDYKDMFRDIVPEGFSVLLPGHDRRAK